MKIKSIPEFRKEMKELAKKYRSMPDDLTDLLNDLLNNPIQGNSLGRNCYKIRLKISSKNTGKSGGARIITCVQIIQDTIHLLSIYDKSTQEDIPDAELTKRLKNIDS